jgi:hypothetical protein
MLHGLQRSSSGAVIVRILLSERNPAEKAIENWGKTARYCMILAVSALCTAVPLLVVVLIR